MSRDHVQSLRLLEHLTNFSTLLTLNFGFSKRKPQHYLKANQYCLQLERKLMRYSIIYSSLKNSPEKKIKFFI